MEHSNHKGSHQLRVVMGRLEGVLGGPGIFNLFESLENNVIRK